MRLKQESDHAEAQRWVDAYVAAGGIIAKVYKGKILVRCGCGQERLAEARMVALWGSVRCRCGVKMRAS
jgi:hypothetical protein